MTAAPADSRPSLRDVRPCPGLLGTAVPTLRFRFQTQKHPQSGRGCQPFRLCYAALVPIETQQLRGPEFQCVSKVENIHGAGSVPRRVIDGEFLRATEDALPFRRNDNPQSLIEIQVERRQRRLGGDFAQAQRLALRLQPDLEQNGLLKFVAHEPGNQRRFL